MAGLPIGRVVQGLKPMGPAEFQQQLAGRTYHVDNQNPFDDPEVLARLEELYGDEPNPGPMSDSRR